MIFKNSKKKFIKGVPELDVKQNGVTYIRWNSFKCYSKIAQKKIHKGVTKRGDSIDCYYHKNKKLS